MNRKRSLILFVIGLTLAVSVGIANAQGPTGTGQPHAPRANAGTAFTYQGQLKNSGAAVNGTCNFQFGLWSDATSLGSQVGTTVTVSSVNVTNGLFTTSIDFGANAFTGDARYLGIAVNCGSGLTTFASRQALTPAPMALALPGLYTQQNGTSPNLIGGYSGNIISPTVLGGTISGGGLSGAENKVWANYATIGGGRGNAASGNASAIGGGRANTASGTGAYIGGGGYDGTSISGNQAVGNASTIGGGWGNSALGGADTVGGGDNNTANGGGATVGGGGGNNASGGLSTVGGGNLNTASGWISTVGGGHGNVAFGWNATVAGGEGNTANSDHDTVGGGTINQASGGDATVGGGNSNTASGWNSTVPGGHLNVAGGDYSFAAGNRAKANHQGSFVWGDSTDADVTSTANDQFVIRAFGGLRLAGAGMNTSTSMFMHQVTAGNICYGDQTVIDNPLTNNDPGAILVVTPNYGSSLSPYVVAGPAKDIPAVFYDSANQCSKGTKWVIYNLNSTPMVVSSVYNVFVIKP